MPRPPIQNDVHARLNPTRVARVERPTGPDELAAAVRRAAREGRSLAICGARHAMGGQQFAAGGVLLDTADLDRPLAYDAARATLEVEAGMRWPAVVAASHAAQAPGPLRRGIAQKQTGADRLSVGGALSANVHGRGLAMRPFVDDVERVTLVDAHGELQRASRDEDPELFALLAGGYGLFGALYSVTLRLAPRRKLRRRVRLVRAAEVVPTLEARVEAGAMYGDFQFAIDPASPDFLDLGVLSTYEPVAPATPMPAHTRALSEAQWLELLHLAHVAKSEAFRRYADHYLATDGQLYWSDTHQLGVYLDDYHRELDQRAGCATPATEVIAELYVPRPALPALLADARRELRARGADAIYGTVRLIRRDETSFLPWAREDFACVVLNLHTEHTPRGVEHTRATFGALADRALARGGSFYLTYDRFATRAQVEAAYPRFEEFLAHKRARDPRGLFQSDWYRHHRALFEAPVARRDPARSA